jgi:hypothetical protein
MPQQTVATRVESRPPGLRRLPPTSSSPDARRAMDWYVEGLARAPRRLVSTDSTIATPRQGSAARC